MTFAIQIEFCTDGVAFVIISLASTQKVDGWTLKGKKQ